MKHRALHVLLILFSLNFLSGCAGYHFNMNNNPLISYNIRSVSVPMFLNQSNIPNIAPMMTSEIITALNDYSGLKVYGGDNEDADAVLIGIIESNDLVNKTFTTAESLYTTGDVKKSIGNRGEFFVPSKTNYQFNVRFILIKRPTMNELEILKSELGKSVKLNPKIVINEVMNVNGSFTRVLNGNSDKEPGRDVNFVKNKGVLNKSLQEICIQTAINFKQVVLNVF